MARNYTRPEFRADDLAAFQAGKCIMINPELADVAVALRKTEKGCRKNKLPLEQGEAAWRAVMDNGDRLAAAGEWSCPKNFRYGIQATVLQIIRLSDNLVGLYCDRQQVLPGQSSRFPVRHPQFQHLKNRASRWYQDVLQIFWTHLTDGEIDECEQQFAVMAMENIAKSKAKADKTRKKLLLSLLRGVFPEFVTEFRVGCLNVARELAKRSLESIEWRQLKRHYPSLTTRYQEYFLEMMEGGMIARSQLNRSAEDSPLDIHLTYWDGPQRLFDDPQLVIEVRNGSVHDRFQQLGDEYKEVSAHLKDVAARDMHPGSATTSGWLRVHVDDTNSLCFVDEVQSDVLEAALAMEQRVAEEFHKLCKDWHLHGFATVMKWTNDIGYRAALHSRASANAKPGMTPSDRKWNTYYRPIIRRFSLSEVTVPGYLADICVDNPMDDFAVRLA